VPDGVPCGRCGPVVPRIGVTFGYMNWCVIVVLQDGVFPQGWACDSSLSARNLCFICVIEHRAPDGSPRITGPRFRAGARARSGARGTLSRLVHAVAAALVDEGWAVDEGTALVIDGGAPRLDGAGATVTRDGERLSVTVAQASSGPPPSG
jgi:hypothetical protein